MKHVIVILLTSLGLVFVPNAARAQSTSTSNDEIGFFAGNMLPSAIEGVSEILPVFGARYSISTLRVGYVDLELANTHASGVDFTTFGVGLRGTVPFSAGTDGFYYGGLDFNYYRPENFEDRKNATGLHVGAGAMMQVTDTLWLRGEMKFMGGPGQSLYLLFGIVFK